MAKAGSYWLQIQRLERGAALQLKDLKGIKPEVEPFILYNFIARHRVHGSPISLILKFVLRQEELRDMRG